MKVHISRMLQLAVGVVDAVPADRRADMAEERLLHLANEHRYARGRSERRDVLWEAAAEVLLNVERLYNEGRLDYALCGLTAPNPAAEPVALLEKIASPIALDIGPNNYKALASTCVKALVDWAQAHPNLDGDEVAQSGLSWETQTKVTRRNDPGASTKTPVARSDESDSTAKPHRR